MDLRDLVPEHIPYLLPDERVISVKEEKITFPKKAVSYREALCLLCNVKNIKDLGKKGPPMASIAPRAYFKVASLRLYEAVFGRDSLYMSDHLLDEFPEVARTTLLHLARYQGVKKNKFSEEELGRIPHEIRDPKTDTIAQLITKEKGWEWPYYGSIDSTLLFIRVLYRYVIETKAGIDFLQEKYIDKNGQEKIMYDALTRAVKWILTRMDTNKEGFIETKKAFKGSLAIQSQQDADTTHPLFHKDGTLGNPKQGIVVTEVQGQAYDALMYAAELLDSEDLRKKALKLKKQIMKLWVQEKGRSYFAPGADRDDKGRLRVLKIKKAIPGFLLNTELFSTNNAQEKQKIRKMLKDWVKVLMSKELLAAGGLRGLASDEKLFTPYEYHNGATWPLITTEVARGLRKQGFKKEAEDLENRVLKVIKETGLYPEYVRGDTNKNISLNNKVIYTKSKKFGIKRREQPPQLYQGWTVSAVANILYNRKARK
ncbi:hypothetical protein KW782_03105 [Candidatus Parcubacteria bacterium]|nr:hypothetical protein [Candidatus Parcubacteria bacterium]